MPHGAPPVDEEDDDSLEGWEARARAHGRVAAGVLGDASSQLWRRQSVVRSLSWLPPESFDFDLADPAQRRFGDYELIEKLGQGGMGVVYRARQLSLDREVALKILAAGPWASAEYGERFHREARHAASLSHPNIVAIHEISRLDDVDFFSMRLVRGASLAERLAVEGPMAARAAAQLMRTIAEALAYAHSLDVLHLDLKPGNVLIETSGEPLVADFGLARRFGDATGIDTNEISGTPSYMAPEQVEPGRAPPSPATDVFGLGAILYECLTGRAPAQGRSTQATMRDVLEREPVAPRAIDPAIPLDLEAICLKCLAKDPRARYRSARALGDDLGRFLAGHAVEVRPRNAVQHLASWARREPATAGASALAIVALMAGLFATTQQWRRAQAKAVEAQQFAKAAQASEARARAQLWDNRLDAVWSRYEAGEPLAAIPSLLDNLREQEAAGETEAAAAERLRVAVLLHQAPQLVDVIDTGETITAVALDRAGTLAAVGTIEGEVLLYALDTRALRWRTSTLGRGRGAPPAEHREIRWIEFLPGGDALLVRAHTPPLAPRLAGSDMFRVDLATGALELPPVDRFPALLYASYSPDGRHALVTTQGPTFHAQVFEVNGWRPLGPPLEYPRQHRVWLQGPEGRWVATTTVPSQRVELYDGRTMRSRVVIDADSRTSAWAFSPDSTLLALGYINGRVQLVPTDGGEVRALEPAPDSLVSRLDFSSDGRMIAAAGRDGTARVWSVETGVLEVAPLRLGGNVSSVEIDGESRTLRTVRAIDGITAIHRLPARGGALALAVPIAPALRQDPWPGVDAVAYVPSLGLAASATSKRLKLWRYKRPPLLSAYAPLQAMINPTFDGRHVPAVSGTRVEVYDVVDRRAVSAPLEHAHPIAIAATTTDGKTLVVLSGRALHSWDWRRGEHRFAPIVFDNTPVRLVIDPNGRSVTLTEGGYRHGLYHELLRSFDLSSGRALGAAIALPGPLVGLRYGDDGKMLFAWHGRTIDAYDVTTGERRFRVEHPAGRARVPYQSLGDVVPSRDGRSVWTLAFQPTVLARWDLATGRSLEQRALPCGDAGVTPERAGVIGRLALPDARGNRVIVNCAGDGAALVEADATGYPMAHGWSVDAAPLSPYQIQAVASPDGRLYARALRNGVIVSDVRTGRPVAPLSTVELDVIDGIESLAFSPDSARLVAATRQGRWITWEFPVDRRPADAIARDAAQLLPDARGASEVTTASLAALRAADPGPVGLVATAPLTAVRTIASQFVPQRETGTGAHMLDLTPYYGTALAAAGIEGQFHGGAINLTRHGVLRLLGIDYDLRGGVALHQTVGAGNRRVDAIALGDVRFEALHALTNCAATIVGVPGVSIFVELHYADGGSAELPIEFPQDDFCAASVRDDRPGPRLAWSVTSQFSSRLYTSRLVNPHPDRPVRGLSLDGGMNRPNGATVFALTLEGMEPP